MAGLFLAAGAAVAEDASSDQIIKALTTSKRVTRHLTDAESAQDKTFIDGLRKRATRSLTLDDRSKITAIAEKKPSIDLEINFDFNSADIGQAAVPEVTALGQALGNDQLKGGTFILAGHTDAKGGDAYNQDLSVRRAEAVKQFLADKYKIDATNLIAVGYGKSQLKNASDPYGSENRRVQIINVTN
jgi:outer membrane protein OmpA-like peptidoglycan-associated protein